MGNLRGRSILDIGSGLGESSVYFAMKGADVTALDLSPEMIVCSQSLAERHGVEIRGVVSTAENQLPFPDCSFDFVYLANIIHHVQDRNSFFKEVARVLKPGGRCLAWDPMAYNPVIGVYRRIATAVRTVDEKPLTLADFRIVQKHFTKVDHREFWLTSLLIFFKYFIIDRLDPNKTRYWKRILEEKEENLGWFRKLQAIDTLLLRVPGLNLLAWNTVICCTK